MLILSFWVALGNAQTPPPTPPQVEAQAPAPPQTFALRCTDSVAVSTRKVGDLVQVDVQLRTASPKPVVWATMTDYDHAARYIPNLRHSESKPVAENLLQVRQIGWVGWDWFGVRVRTEYQVQLFPHDFRLQGRLVSGDMRSMEMRAHLQDTPQQRTELIYQMKTDPGALMPGFLAEKVLQQQAQVSFEALLKEMQRRSPPCVP